MFNRQTVRSAKRAIKGKKRGKKKVEQGNGTYEERNELLVRSIEFSVGLFRAFPVCYLQYKKGGGEKET